MHINRCYPKPAQCSAMKTQGGGFRLSLHQHCINELVEIERIEEDIIKKSATGAHNVNDQIGVFSYDTLSATMQKNRFNHGSQIYSLGIRNKRVTVKRVSKVKYP